jgi:hypothetical protein
MKLSEWMEMNNLLISYETRHYVAHDGPQPQASLYCHFKSLWASGGNRINQYTECFETSLWGNGNSFEEAARDLVRDTLEAKEQGNIIGTARRDSISIPKTLEIDLDFI